MIRRQRVAFVGVSSILFLSLLCACATSPEEMDGRVESSLSSLMAIKPIPELAPEDVVAIQLSALKANDRRDRGIELAYRFISARNRELAGDVDGFARFLQKESYQPMFIHIDYVLGPTKRTDEFALVGVIMGLPGGNTSTYIFILKKQEGGDYHDCWMTEGAMKVIPNIVAPPLVPQTLDS